MSTELALATSFDPWLFAWSEPIEIVPPPPSSELLSLGLGLLVPPPPPPPPQAVATTASTSTRAGNPSRPLLIEDTSGVTVSGTTAGSGPRLGPRSKSSSTGYLYWAG
jgi:hypothetical protein